MESLACSRAWCHIVCMACRVIAIPLLSVFLCGTGLLLLVWSRLLLRFTVFRWPVYGLLRCQRPSFAGLIAVPSRVADG